MKHRILKLVLPFGLALPLALAPSLADAGTENAEVAKASATPLFASLSLPGTDGRDHTLKSFFRENTRYLVVTFFSASCPCQEAHDSRLKELHKQWSSRGVEFVSVDSEADSSLSADITEARRRGYPFPILSDVDGKLADAFDAKFATFTVILDREGRVLYRGGIDSDKSHLTDNARHYVRTALSQLFADQAPNPAETKSLGCFLRRR